MLALLSGLIVGFWNTLTKKVSGKYAELQMMLLDGSSTFTIGLIGSLIIKETLPPLSNISPWIWIIAFAVANLSASFLLIRGFKYIEAQTGSLILPMEIIFASLFGFIFFREVLSINVYLGGIFIFLAATLPALKSSDNQ